MLLYMDCKTRRLVHLCSNQLRYIFQPGEELRLLVYISEIRSLKGNSFLHPPTSRSNAWFLCMDGGRLSIVPQRTKVFGNICAHWDHTFPGASEIRLRHLACFTNTLWRQLMASGIFHRQKKKETQASLVSGSELQICQTYLTCHQHDSLLDLQILCKVYIWQEKKN